MTATWGPLPGALRYRQIERLQQEIDQLLRTNAEQRLVIQREWAEKEQWKLNALRLQGYVEKLVAVIEHLKAFSPGMMGRPTPPTVPLDEPATLKVSAPPASSLVPRPAWRRPLHDPPGVTPTTPPLGLGALGLGGPVSSDWEG